MEKVEIGIIYRLNKDSPQEMKKQTGLKREHVCFIGEPIRQAV
jgi:hypothetical protein